MKTHARILIVVLAGWLAGSAGCGKMGGRMAAAFNRKLNKPSWRQRVAMALDADDADNRRMGINYMAPDTKGDDEGTLKLFAFILANDRDPFVRAAAVTALGIVGNTDFAPDVIAALEDHSEVVRWDAAKALANLVADDALEPLIAHAFGDPSMNVRISATRSLAGHRKPRCVRMLLQLMDARNLSVRREAHKALVAIFRMDLGEEPEHWADVASYDIPPAMTQVQLDAQKNWWRRFIDKRRRLREEHLAEQQAEEEAFQEDYERRLEADRDQQDGEGDEPERSWWQRFRDEQARIRRRESPDRTEPLRLEELAPGAAEHIRPDERLDDEDADESAQTDDQDAPDQRDIDPMGPAGADAAATDRPPIPQPPDDDAPQDLEIAPAE